MADVISIDGSYGEGGGQILRTSLALSAVTGKPFRIGKIRAGRKNPGLGRQHLTSVNAAAAVAQAEVTGNAIGSTELYFAPGIPKAGKYGFDVGTAGSCTLVLQTILPALVITGGRSEVVLEGGTHNPFAPPYDFLAKVFLPVLAKMGLAVRARLERPGFYPAGGGKIVLEIEPCGRLNQLEITERGQLKRRCARAVVARLPRQIAERELRVVQRALGLDAACLSVEEVQDSRGPGNVVIIEIECEHAAEVATAFGERGVPAERVAEKAASEAKEYLASTAPVGKHLADQLLIPFALAGGGKFRTLPLTEHALTNCHVIRQFLDVEVNMCELSGNVVEVTFGRTG